MENKPLVLAFWKVRGKGHIVRMVLEYLHIPYEEIIYSSPESFFNQHKQIAHMAQNLPFLKDGDKTIFGIMPCMTYLAKKYNQEELMGKTLKDQTTIDMFHWDLQYLFKKLICSPVWKMREQEKVAAQYKILKENVEPALRKYEDKLTKDQQWFFEYISYIEFCLVELVLYVQMIYPGKIEEYPKLLQISKNFKQIPEIKRLQSLPKIKQLCLLPKEMCKGIQRQGC